MYQEPMFTCPLVIPSARDGDVSKALGTWVAQLRAALDAPVAAIDYERPVVSGTPQHSTPYGVCVLDRLREVEALLSRAARGIDFWKPKAWSSIYVEAVRHKDLARGLGIDPKTLRIALVEFETAIVRELERTNWIVE